MAPPDRRRPVAASAIAVTAALLVAGCSSSPNAATPTPTRTPARSATATPTTAPPSAGTIAATIPSLGGLTARDDYYGIAADGTSVWIYNGETGMLTQVDEATRAVHAHVQLRPGCVTGRGCGNLAIGDGAVWVASIVDSTVTRVDASAGRAVATIKVGRGTQVYTTPGVVWSADYTDDSYARIDPRTNAVAATLSNHLRPEAVAYAGGAVWLCDSGGAPGLTKLDAGSLAVEKTVDIHSGGAETTCIDAVALGSSSLYVAAVQQPPVVVDAATGAVSAAPAPPGDAGVERGIAGDAHGAWQIDSQLGLTHLDATGTVTGQLALPQPAGVAVDAHGVWVMSGNGTLYQVTPSA